MPPTNISFPSAKSNVSLEVLFLLALRHCPHGKVHVPNTELESRYLYWGPELHECFHLGDSLCQGSAGEPIFLKKGGWERRKSMKTQPGGYSPYASLDYRVELQHITLSGKDMYVFLLYTTLSWLVGEGESQEAS